MSHCHSHSLSRHTAMAPTATDGSGRRTLERPHFGPATLFKSAYEKALYTDVGIAAASQPGKVIGAHRVVLQAVSAHLAKKMDRHGASTEPILLKNVDYEMLKAVMDLVYLGRAEIEDDDVEDFYQVVRSLNIRLDRETNLRVYQADDLSGGWNHGSEATSETSSPVAIVAAQRKRQRLYLPKKPIAVKREGPSSDDDVPLKRAKIEPVTKTAPAASFSSAASPASPSVSSDGESRITISRTISTTAPPDPSPSSRAFNPRENFLSPAADRNPAPALCGPKGYFWLEVLNQLDTGAHAVRDKYGEGLSHHVGSYKARESLYLAYATARHADEILDVMQRNEPNTYISPSTSLPDEVMSLLRNLEENNQSAITRPIVTVGQSSPPPPPPLSIGGERCIRVTGAGPSSSPMSAERQSESRSDGQGKRMNVLHIFGLTEATSKKDILRMLRRNGLHQLMDKDVFGEPGTCEFKVKLSTPSTVKSIVERISGRELRGAIMQARPSDSLW